jgi:endonuclease/exonuclease/phosphatase family metal-dependent hydrolase
VHEAAPTTLSLVSHNIHSCVGRDGRTDPQRIADVLRPLDADIIAVQGVAVHRDGGGIVRDQLTLLGDALAMRAIAGPTLKRELGDYGNGILTRVPTARIERVELGGREPRGALVVDFAVGDERLRLVCTHLGLRQAERARQAEQLQPYFGAERGVAVLAGDLNEWRRSGGWLRRALPELATQRPLRTFPARLPLWPLDRILVRPASALIDLRRICDPETANASDHLPLHALLSVGR